MTSNPVLSPNHQAAQAALAAAEARFIANNPLSKAQHDLAIGTLPGGNTRTLLHTSPFPLAMRQGKDSYVWDVPPPRTNTPTPRSSARASASTACAWPTRAPKPTCTRWRAARHHTGRRRVVVFSGGYHGAVLGFGDGVPGVNAVDREDFVVVPRYNDLVLARRVIEGVEGLAAVLVEAVQGAGGCIVGGREFLMGVREAAREKGAVFILDEVMTSRLAPGGLGVEMGLEPDMVTLGKYLGGGLAFGAFGGREEVMRVYDPRVPGSLPHSGTFNNNTLVMSVGKTALGEVYTPEVCVEFNEKADRFRERLEGVAKGSRLSFTGKGSMIGLHFTEDGTEDITCGEDVKGKTTQDLKDLFWFEMLEAGFWVTRRGLIALILGTPDEDLDQFVEAVGAFLERHKAIMML
ncbi:hypothetical protein CHGG_00329 [Chaetomium globosum CBS 148.51]|uniref:Glutamate-1-semialdehyde 2,1-aminomutase n=1 Tax=Chaetomium globosum (strain ATCC 6205 / CBS 148.51 / DSM 1962 / NBRC 6347 / NRRL 1970) TaxID=306901 RepID=Q2HHH5_CHAGB|nr:uncharacterized protein CHGG_00329 [Chaetomium globosum CBS 148.51]EAQ92094.1 hypothetical protein CHGG_00329 [Chaetomium globosum CBS 148.51]